MQRNGPRPRRRRAALLLALAIGLWLGSGSGALAHEQLVESSPAEGEVLADSPSEIVLTFTADVLPISPIILVRDSAGNVVHDDEPVVEGNVVSTQLPKLADGAYQVVWRVVSGDGHPIEGTVGFAVGSAMDPTPSQSPTEAVSGQPGDDDAIEPAGSGGGQGLVLLGLGAALVVVALVLLAARSRRRG